MGLPDQYFITKDHLVQLIALWASVCRENYVLIKYIPTVGKFIIIISLKTKNIHIAWVEPASLSSLDLFCP